VFYLVEGVDLRRKFSSLDERIDGDKKRENL